MRARILLITLLFPTLARAEYRAFELVITAPDGTSRVEISNLNPGEYRRFNPIPAGGRVIYRDTWRCRGNTSWNQPICPSPRQPSPQK